MPAPFLFFDIFFLARFDLIVSPVCLRAGVQVFSLDLAPFRRPRVPPSVEYCFPLGKLLNQPQCSNHFECVPRSGVQRLGVGPWKSSHSLSSKPLVPRFMHSGKTEILGNFLVFATACQLLAYRLPVPTTDLPLICN